MKTSKYFFPILLITLISGLGCRRESRNQTPQSVPGLADQPISREIFGNLPDGRPVFRFTLDNEAGMEVDVISYGGIITRWTAPDSDGEYRDVVLGFDSLPPYVAGHPYFGAIIGRYGNRIAGGRFELNGAPYILATNNGENHLHGGNTGFDKVLWKTKASRDAQGAHLELYYISRGGEEGYPGNLRTRVTYTLRPDNALEMSYEATTDSPTVVNLTNHTYFNLSGDFSRDILDHELRLYAEAYLPVDAGLIPTGEIRPVEDTPFDFSRAKPIGRDIGSDDPQIRIGGGYDHCWVVGEDDGSLRPVARVEHPESGRVLEIHSTEPGVQFYTGNFLDGTLPAKGGGTYGHRSGFCLETQHFPDSPNRPEFPSTRLDPGETYSTRTVFRFTTL